jgi:hypothetical protein
MGRMAKDPDHRLRRIGIRGDDYQIAWTRVPSVGSSTYSFTCILGLSSSVWHWEASSPRDGWTG